MLMLKALRQVRVVVAVVALMLPGFAAATLMQSNDFRLDPNVADTFGGASSSGSYQLTDSGGQTVVGAGSSQSYHLGQGYISELAHSLQLTVVPSGTYAYWPFDTGSGPVAYDVGPNGDDASLINAPSWITGMVGRGVLLNGSSQYVTTATQTSGPAAFTTEFWFKTAPSYGQGGYLMGFGDAASGASSTADRLVYLTDTGKLVFGTHTGSYNVVTSPSSYTDGSWHHVAASLGSAGLKLYVDGVIVAYDGATTTAGSYTGYWRLGYDSLTGWPSAPTSNYAAASLDEARVTTRQLRDVEVTNDYTAGANALQSAFTLPSVTPGQSQTYSIDAVVKTDAGGYDLYVQRPHPLTHTDNSTTIPDIAGSIASPISWVEGTTKGFGFTLASFYGTDLNFGTSPTFTSPNGKFAALPATATVYHARSGLSGGVQETSTIQYRADTLPQQKQGTYSTTVIYTATIKP
jgi:hypothetical protein